ncbi:hypothetical protein GCM10010172_48720 [Paractinoplanes ferrugineus]|uniref:DUF1707 domain-containing protein n=1 Tax=Paractinoplanes ferrugineus TaxID=113564 RepID=A0A919MCW4_9ACTN|nr:DUF1707 domain-containing protein [Actinoplanes ferrugineus]GIE11133.1 hypothetical protein Afe05nite_29730 [Actinoplanes ferrugineus]
MAAELTPEPRLSDTERQSVVEQLNHAVGEGRLTLSEFEDRLQAVFAARTRAELAPFVADLPAASVPEEMTLRPHASSVKRTGNWLVPRRIRVEGSSSSVRLDMTEARPVDPTVELILDLQGASVTVVLPRGASATIHDVDLSASSATAKVPEAGGLHIVARGQLRSSTLTLRYQRRFLWWRW